MSTPSHERELIPAAEFARRRGVVKSRVSAWFQRGLPFVEGQDDHGRKCKFVEPAVADIWCATHLTPTLRPDGRFGGTPMNTSRKQRAEQKAPPAPAPSMERPSPTQRTEGPSSAPSAGEGSKRRVFDFSAPPGQPPPELVAQSRSDDPITEAAHLATETQRHRAQAEADKSAIIRLRLLQAQGALLDRGAALDAHEHFVQMVATTLERAPADHATDLASKLGCTEHQAYLALRDVIDGLRGDLAIHAEREQERLGLEFEDAAEGAAGPPG